MLQDKDIPVLDDERLAEEAASNDTAQASAKSLASQAAELIEDVRTLAHAEVDYYRAKLSVNVSAAKRILLLFGISVLVGAMAIIALILGILLILSEYVGAPAATAIVAGSALLLAWISMNMAVRRAKKLPLDENDSRDS